jgi:hypothetical protein
LKEIREEQDIELEQMQDIIGVLTNIRNGGALMAINEDFTQLVKAVIATGKKGALTVKINLKPAGMNRQNEVTEMGVDLNVTSTIPKHPPGAGLFFVGKHGVLSRNDPAQTEMFEGMEK